MVLIYNCCKNVFLTIVLLIIYSIFVPGIVQAKDADFSMTVQSGHCSTIRGVVYAPDGKTFATYAISGARDLSIKIWEVKTLRLLRTIPGNHEICSIAWSPDSSKIVSITKYPFDIVIRDTATGTVIKTVPVKYDDGAGKQIFYTPDGKTLVMSTQKGIKLYDTSSWTVTRVIAEKFNECKNYIEPRVDLNRIATANLGDISIYEYSTGKLLIQIENDSNEVSDYIYSLAMSRDGRFVATGRKGGEIKIHDTASGMLLKTLKGHTKRVNSVVWSPDGSRLYSCSGDTTDVLAFESYNAKENARYKKASDNTVRIWDTVSGKCLYTREDNAISVNALALSPDNKTMVTVSADQTVKMRSVETGEAYHVFDTQEDIINEIVVSPDGKFIYAAVGDHWSSAGDHSIKVWELQNGRLRENFTGHKKGVACIALSPDGKILASASSDMTMRLWDTVAGKCIRVINIDAGGDGYEGVTQIKFTSDGKSLVTCGNEMPICVWDVATGKAVKAFGTTRTCISVSPDGKTLASELHLYDNPDYLVVELWSLDKGRSINPLKAPSDDIEKHNAANWMEYSHDGTRLATASFNYVRIWKTSTGTQSVSFKSESLIGTIAFSPDDETLAVGTGDGIILFDTDSGKKIKECRGEVGGELAWSPDGKYLLTGMGSRIDVYNIKNDEIMTLLSSGKEWVVYMKNGNFDASSNGGKLAAVTSGLHAYDIDQFALKYNRPDLILSSMGLGIGELIDHYRGQYLRRLRRAGFKESDLVSGFHVPETVIISSKQNEKFYDMEISFSDDKYNLRRYNIFINDVPLFGSYGKEISGSNTSVRESIELSSGKNKIEVSCTNEKGMESYRELINASYNKPVTGSLYFLGFGVSQYKDSELNLKYADKDARDLAGTFSKMKKKYGSVNVKTYLNGEVTADAFDRAKEFISAAKVDDTFVLFIAGHGVHARDKDATYYYLTHNADRNDLAGSCVNFDTIEDLMQGIAPRNKIFLMDTCESGEIEDNSENAAISAADTKGSNARSVRGFSVSGNGSVPKRSYLFQKDRYIYNDMVRRSGAIVFSSSRGGEYSWESDVIKNGWFTREIIRALGGSGVAVKNGTVSTDELRRGVAESVAKGTSDLQHPTVDRDNLYQKFSFPVVK